MFRQRIVYFWGISSQHIGEHLEITYKNVKQRTYFHCSKAQWCISIQIKSVHRSLALKKTLDTTDFVLVASPMQRCVTISWIYYQTS